MVGRGLILDLLVIDTSAVNTQGCGRDSLPGPFVHAAIEQWRAPPPPSRLPPCLSKPAGRSSSLFLLPSNPILRRCSISH